MAVPITLTTRDEIAISSDISSELLVNCFPSLREESQVAKTMLIGSHGHLLFGTDTAGSACRGSRANDDGTAGYIVIDDTFYSVNTSGVKTSRGTLATSSGRVSIAVGALQVMITDGASGYSYTPASTTFATIVDPQFPTNPTICEYVDGYFITIGTVSGQIAVALSDLNDVSNWSVLNQLVPSGFPSTLVSFVVVNRYLWLLGSSFAESRVNTGISGEFPYERVNFVEFGCAAAHSVATINGYAYWLARTRRGKAMLVRANSSDVEVINNEDMNNTFQSFSAVADAFAYTYTDEGQSFYEITFPTANETWVYCVDTDHFYKKEASDGGRFIASCYMFLNNKHIIGARNSGRMFEMSLSYYDEDGGEPVPRRVITPTLYSDHKYLKVSLVRCIVDSNTYDVDGNNWLLDVSRDGGDTYAALFTSTVTPSQDYAQFTKLSAGRRLTFRLVFNAAKEFRLINCMVYIGTAGR